MIAVFESLLYPVSEPLDKTPKRIAKLASTIARYGTEIKTKAQSTEATPKALARCLNLIFANLYSGYISLFPAAWHRKLMPVFYYILRNVSISIHTSKPMLAVRFFLFYNSWDGRDSAESTKSTHGPAF